MTIETLPNKHRKRDYEVELEALEFTSLCPLTGAPDFGTLTIRYVPGEALVELKSLRDYLTSFELLDEIVSSAAPRFCEVEGYFNVRGGIETRVRARMGENPLDD